MWEKGGLPSTMKRPIAYPPDDSWQQKIRNSWIDILPVILGVSMLVLLPYIHLGIFYRFWVEKEAVDRETCTCSCWDTLFKGSYQQTAAGYKHVYFNLTRGTLAMWAVTVCFGAALYESLRRLCALAVRRRLRASMLVLYGAALYPNYYAWWAYFNYTNDGFYQQWNHQTFFTLTELASSVMVLWLCDRATSPSPPRLLVIILIAMLHIVAAGGDNYIRNVFMRRGKAHQVWRDFGLMVPDLLNIAIPAALWVMWCREHNVPLHRSVARRDIMIAATVMASLLVLWYHL